MNRKKEDADADEKLLMIRVIQMSYIAQNSLSEAKDIFVFSRSRPLYYTQHRRDLQITTLLALWHVIR